MQHPYARASAKAAKYLESCIENGIFTAPKSVHLLADEAGVSYVTMWHTVRRFKESGVLAGEYRVGKGPADPASDVHEDAPQSAFGRLYQRFIRDLLSGSIIRGTNLLSIKELTDYYASSPGTIRRLLDHASQQGLAVPAGRHWSTLRQPAVPNLSIVLLAHNYDDRQRILRLPALERDVLSACEIACAQMHIRLQVLGMQKHDTAMELYDPLKLNTTSLPNADTIAGYIYLLNTEHAYDQSLIDKLLATRKPVALIDNGTNVQSCFAKAIPPSMIRIFNSTAHEHTGMAASAYLLAKGHRHVAYISPFHADAWSKIRYEGMCAAFSGMGPDASVTLCALSKSVKSGDSYSIAGQKNCRGDALIASIARWRCGVPGYFSQSIDRLVNKTVHEEIFYGGELTRTLEVLFDNAAKESRISAWIVANDLVACQAIEYCRQKMIDIPNRLALISFDDTIESRESRITSYSFNFGSIAPTILNYILYPEGAFWRRHRVVEIEGRFVERSTG